MCESFLQPLEARLLSPDGALDEQLLAEPARVTVSLPEAWAAYRGVYARYVGELGPVLRRARAELDQLLRSNLGQSLARHGALLSGIGGGNFAASMSNISFFLSSQATGISAWPKCRAR